MKPTVRFWPLLVVAAVSGLLGTGALIVAAVRMATPPAQAAQVEIVRLPPSAAPLATAAR